MIEIMVMVKPIEAMVMIVDKIAMVMETMQAVDIVQAIAANVRKIIHAKIKHAMIAGAYTATMNLATIT